ncbi:hypothetical protein, partial [Escherichia coli]|uniref:hypothetical protein n=1 Tax=Escherichia coli TaxID=562 RepID=UPI001F4A97F4
TANRLTRTAISRSDVPFAIRLKMPSERSSDGIFVLAAVFSNHSEGTGRINLFDCVWVFA